MIDSKTMVSDRVGTIVCGECYEIQDRAIYVASKNTCISCRVKNKGIIIDELIAQTICILNQKGYVTTNCCSGHIYSDGYISISIEFNMVKSINEFIKLKNIKTKANFYNYPDETNAVIRWEYGNRKNSAESRMKAIIRANDILLRWAKWLPKYEN